MPHPSTRDGSAGTSPDWPAYLMEAGGLAVFMLVAGSLTTLFEHPASPVRQAIGSELLRHALVGLGMGVVIAALTYAPTGKRSGAHINPAVTWAFLQQGKISGRNALFYTLAQFAGGLAAPALLLAVLGDAFSHPDVRYAATLPGPQGQLVAFVAEFAITFVLMLTVLVCINSERWKPRLGVVVGVLVALYVTFESPLSGMSMNPARSFGSAATSGLWEGLWLYFTAPPLAALMAAVVYTGLRRSGLIAAAGASPTRRCLLCDFEEGPHFPVPKASL